MKKIYTIEVPVDGYIDVVVEAENKDEAIFESEKAVDILAWGHMQSIGDSELHGDYVLNGTPTMPYVVDVTDEDGNSIEE